MSGYIIVTGGGHLADAALLQVLDGDASPADARQHLTECADCSRRYSALRIASTVLRASLPDVPMPRLDFDPARRRAWVIPIPLAIAASIVVLASAAAATPPVRHWIMQRLSPSPAAPATNQTGATIPTPDVRRASVVASFVPADSVLTIRIERPQPSGVLRLVVATSDKVSAQVEGGTDTEEFLVMPSGIRVTNAATSVADYRVRVPASIRSIRITIGDKDAILVANDGRLDRGIPVR
jgi:hypothetical protein